MSLQDGCAITQVAVANPNCPPKPFGKQRRFDEDELSLWLQALSRGRAA
jgi:hypothetical protein